MCTTKNCRLKPVMEEAAKLAPLFKALSDETRVKIIYALAGRNYVYVI